MIKSIASSTDLAGFEQLTASGNATPELLINCSVVRADLSVADQLIYDEAIALFSTDRYTEITNTIANLSIDRITSQVLVEEKEDVDFALLTEVDKDKLRALLAIFVSLNEIPE